MRPWLVSVCAGRWQVDAIRRAQAAGLRVLALDGDAAAPGLSDADRGVVVDIRDENAVIAAVADAGITPAGVACFTAEAGMAAAAALREKFDLPGPRRELVRLLTNKAAQRARWSEVGDVPIPAWRMVDNAEAALRALADVGGPVIVKPVDSAGSRGVARVDEAGQMLSAFDEAMKHSRGGQVIIESWMDGVEYTVETFAHRGITHVLAITEKKKVPGTNGTVASELATTTLPHHDATRIAQSVVRALDALGHTDGPGHTEVILRPREGPGIVEAAGRGGGFMVFEGLVPEASGFDIATATALQAVGQAPPPIPEQRRGAVLRFFPSRAGTVRSIEGFEKANLLAGVRAAPLVHVGERVGAVAGDKDRMGYILASGVDTATARSLADDAESMIRFQVEVG